MSNNNVTSEWKECRDSISRFDGYLFRLRISVFTVFSLALSALISSSSIAIVNVFLQNPGNIFFIYAILCTYILSIYILDRYYERMLMIAVYRASYIETFRLENFKIGLTTEIEFQKEKMLKDARKKSFLLRFGLKGSEMVNIIYSFLFLLVSLFSASLIYQHGLDSKSTTFMVIIFVSFIALGYSANRFLVEPKLLIKLRSQAVKSPVIVSKDEISFLVNKIANEIHEHYADRTITIVSILNGARPFTNDLMHKLSALNMRVNLHLLRIESTKDNHHTNTIEFIFGANADFKDKDVLIVDDLIDTGKTISVVKDFIQQSSPASVSIAALVNKFSDTLVKADFIGIDLGLLRANFPLSNGITDYWLFGYGMDLNEQFRDLDFIGWIEKK